MTKFSRVAKYEELRNRLNNEVDNEIKSKELSEFASRLNKIKPVETSTEMDHDPIHEKREQYLSNTTNIPISAQTKTFDNEYLDEYISEVKQYNREQGLLVSDDTGKNILNELYGSKIPSINKPFPSTQEKKEPDIPFQSSPSINPYSGLSDEDLEKTRSDIASEVKNLINNDSFYNPIEEITEEINQDIDINQTERNKIIEETDKMKLQLVEYEDNLDDFEDKMQSTSRILNFVLVILIFVLIVVLGFVVYWILLNKGII